MEGCSNTSEGSTSGLLHQAMQGLFVETAEVSEDVNNGLVSVSFNFIDLAVRSGPLNINPCLSFLTELAGINAFVFLDSSNRLILLGHRQDTAHLSAGTYMVCNPTTRQWTVVPASGSRQALSHTYLAFDPVVSSHFHLVQFQMRDADEFVESLHVYSSETGTWSENQIEEQEEQEQGQLQGWHHEFKLEVLDYHCAFVNGFLHLIVWGPDRQHILVFDVQGMARRIINVPGMADGSQRDNSTFYLGQSQGYLHCVTVKSVDDYTDKLYIWILQDYDTQEWVLKRTVNSLDVFGETEEMPEYQVIDIHQDSNVLVFLNLLTRELRAHNMDSKEVSVLATFQDHKCRGDFARYVPYYLVSPALTNMH